MAQDDPKMAHLGIRKNHKKNMAETMGTDETAKLFPWHLLHKTWQPSKDFVSHELATHQCEHLPHNAATSMCEKGDQWEQALTSPHKIRHDGKSAGCEKGGPRHTTEPLRSSLSMGALLFQRIFILLSLGPPMCSWQATFLDLPKYRGSLMLVQWLALPR